MGEQNKTFESARTRLEEIVDKVNAEGTTLEEALSLYEEAVKIGLAACDLSEQDVLAAAGELPDEKDLATGDQSAVRTASSLSEQDDSRDDEADGTSPSDSANGAGGLS